MSKYIAWMRSNRATVSQFVRFVVIGLISNSIGYSVYLFVTYLGVPPKTAVTVLYTIAATITYVSNRRLTFNDSGAARSSGLRYALAHGIGYTINVTLLAIFHDNYGYPHQYVQIFSVGVVAVYLFFAMKFFVFRTSS